MKLKEKILDFFGLGYKEPTGTMKIYQEIAKDKPVIEHDKTPIEELVDNYDPALAGLKKLKTPGERLRHLRLTRGWSQEELAKLSDVSKSHIGELEQGTYKTTKLATACRIADALSVKVDAIWETVLTK